MTKDGYFENADNETMRRIWSKFDSRGYLKAPLTSDELILIAQIIIWLNENDSDVHTLKDIYRIKLCADGTQRFPLSKEEVKCLYNVREILRKKSMDGSLRQEMDAKKASDEAEADREWKEYYKSIRKYHRKEDA